MGANRPDEPILTVRGLTKRFGGVVAVDGLDLDLDPGEILGVIGPNGAGKSTLLRCIVGEHRPDRGEIRLDGERVDRLPAHRIPRTGIAIAHQIPRPFGGLTTRQNILVGSFAGGERAATGVAGVEEILELTELAPKADRLARDLTLLDQKRLGLGRALAINPKVLLLDEVGAGLIESELEGMVELVTQINRLGTSMVIVEHVEAVIRSLADRIVVLDWGREIAQGTSDEIAANKEVRRVYLGDTKGNGVAQPRTPRRTRPRQLLRLAGVSASYGRSAALEGIDLDVGEGEVVAVLGANGAGKTTLARVVSGLMSPSRGQVFLGVEEITRVPAHGRVGMGISHCHEGRRVFAELSIEENLELGAYLERSPKAIARRLEAAYALFPELLDKASDAAATLSGGQQQMLAIGRSLMSDPRILILDEASLGLAPQAVDRIYASINDLRERGVSLLLIEQNAYRSLAVADHVYVLDHGHRSFSGDPAALAQEVTLSEAYFGKETSDKADRSSLVATARKET